MCYVRWTSLLAILYLLTGCALPTGILRSRWAMDDPEYAEKYCDGAEKGDLLGKVKQAADARFQDDAFGVFVSTGYSHRAGSESGLFSADIGAESYFTSFLTGRVSLLGMVNDDDFFYGIDSGLRLQTPTRLAPFVGVGVFGGLADEDVLADMDGIDNNDDGIIDEQGEESSRVSDSLAAIYPEVGVNFWWNPSVRLTGYGRYLFTDQDDNADDWQFGFGVAIFRNLWIDGN